MIEVRCPRCNKLLFKAASTAARIEIVCNGCKLLLAWPSTTPEILVSEKPPAKLISER